ncbi:hypothetical protein B5K06_33125 [Rhizobium grahamii]|uniref:Uncharacterized protein n=1 Tax=Rhizobium grahamii TaxID=1120045 RepID=A0A370KEE8_9HYPH|nr:hypothetical protein B5K06_33125 [Rhizobium grahamii]
MTGSVHLEGRGGAGDRNFAKRRSASNSSTPFAAIISWNSVYPALARRRGSRRRPEDGGDLAVADDLVEVTQSLDLGPYFAEVKRNFSDKLIHLYP